MDTGQRFSVSISLGTILATVAIGLLLVLAYYLRDLILIVLTAIVLASAVEPAIQWFMKKRMHRNFAVALVYAIIFIAFFGVAYLLFPPLVAELRSFIVTLPQFVESVGLENVAPGIAGTGVEPLISSSALATLLFQLQDLVIPTGEGTFNALYGLFGAVFSFLLIIVLSVYFAFQETGVDDFLRVVVPLKHQAYALDLWKRSHHKIGLWMQGQLVLSLIIGVLGYLWLSIFQVPYAFLIAIFAAFIEIVPVFGSIISGLFAVMVAAVAGGLHLALIVAGGFLVINLLQSNLIYPLVVKKIVGVPPLMVILAMIAGGQLAGLLGVLLSVPLAATLQELIADFQKSRKEKAA